MNASELADVVCDFSHRIKHLFVLSFASVVILLFALPYVEPGTGTYVITVLQLVTFGVLLVVTLGLLVLCGRRQPGR